MVRLVHPPLADRTQVENRLTRLLSLEKLVPSCSHLPVAKKIPRHLLKAKQVLAAPTRRPPPRLPPPCRPAEYPRLTEDTTLASLYGVELPYVEEYPRLAGIPIKTPPGIVTRFSSCLTKLVLLSECNVCPTSTASYCRVLSNDESGKTIQMKLYLLT